MKKFSVLFSILAIVTVFVSGCATNPVTETDSLSKNSDIATTDQISDERFNESGQAKAIENETDLWEIYDDARVGFSVKYPQDVTSAGPDQFITEADKVYLKTQTKDIGQVDLPWELSEEEAQENIEALSGGSFGVNNAYTF